MIKNNKLINKKKKIIMIIKSHLNSRSGKFNIHINNNYYYYYCLNALASSQQDCKLAPVIGHLSAKFEVLTGKLRSLVGHPDGPLL